MKFCPKCGSEIENGARFCQNCGFDLQAGAMPGTPVGMTNQPVSQAVTPQAPVAATITGNSGQGYQSNLGLFGAMNQYFQNYANFNGRTSRANYWWCALGTSLIGIVVFSLVLAVNNNVPLYLESAILLLPNLTVVVRRLHDSNHSGWVYLWVFLPIIGPIYVLVLMFKAGDKVANRFG